MERGGEGGGKGGEVCRGNLKERKVNMGKYFDVCDVYIFLERGGEN